MSIDAVIAFIEQHRRGRIALTTHQRPDGDALGSAFGLAGVLRAIGIDAVVVNARPAPAKLSYLAEKGLSAEYGESGWHSGYDCLGILDCGETARLDPINQPAAALPAFTIDHHISSRGVGQAVWVDPDASSVGEMVVRLCRKAGWAIPAAAATALWTAIVTDTGRFSYENASADALEAGRDCILAGADPVLVAQKLYQSVSPAERLLQARALSRMELSENGKLATTWLVRADFAEAGIGVEGAQDMVNLLRDTDGVEVSVFLSENPANPDAGVKASIRTVDPRDAILLAASYGGGGHQRAAGCTVPGDIAAAKREISAAAKRLYFR